jgi:hypothetical protein
MTSKVKADPHVGISAGIGPSCPVRRGRSPAGMAKPGLPLAAAADPPTHGAAVWRSATCALAPTGASYPL